MRFASDLNLDVPAARPGEFRPLVLGRLEIWPPVVLAPMAGVTNYPFRQLCRAFGAGLYVSEMITARGLVAGNAMTELLASGGPDERPRSVQLYGSDPAAIAEATRRLTAEGIDHIDLNFGCPAPKITRHGGGSADRKSTRLNSSHVAISYAVFCLKKKRNPLHRLGAGREKREADRQKR